ncbi:hypothetical protein DIPPA_10171 [Diplonema papillatum]|nr:hypothetical protein DIPPA_10171 [Diplonema papillatum]
MSNNKNLVIRATAGAMVGLSTEFLKDVDPRYNLLIRAFIGFVSIRGALKYFNDKASGKELNHLKYVYVVCILLACLTGLNK